MGAAPTAPSRVVDERFAARFDRGGDGGSDGGGGDGGSDGGGDGGSDGGSDDGSDGDDAVSGVGEGDIAGEEDGEGVSEGGGGDAEGDLEDEAGAGGRGARELLPARVRAFVAEQAARGLVYVARPPPFMRAAKLRHIMEGFGRIGRVCVRRMGECITVYDDGECVTGSAACACAAAVPAAGALLFHFLWGCLLRGCCGSGRASSRYLCRVRVSRLTHHRARVASLSQLRHLAPLTHGRGSRALVCHGPS